MNINDLIKEARQVPYGIWDKSKNTWVSPNGVMIAGTREDVVQLVAVATAARKVDEIADWEAAPIHTISPADFLNEARESTKQFFMN